MGAQRTLEEELVLAAAIQAKLFPAALPELIGCELAACSRLPVSAGATTTMYCDIGGRSGRAVPAMRCRRLGKGLPASLLMSNFQATLRASLGFTPELLDLAVRTKSCCMPEPRQSGSSPPSWSD